MPILDFGCRLNFDRYFRISQNGIHFHAGVCAPVRKFIRRTAISDIGNEFLYHKVFKSMAIFGRTGLEAMPPGQVICDTYIKKIEFGRMKKLALYGFVFAGYLSSISPNNAGCF